VKIIKTHLNPDLDAVASVWLLKRFLLGWEGAQVEYVMAKNTEEAKNIDGEILYVDVGGGPLDHHDTGQYLSATSLTWEYVKQKRGIEDFKPIVLEALEKLVAVITEVDNARDLNWPEIKQTRHLFYLHSIVGALRGLAETDEQVTEFGMRALEAVLLSLKSEIKAVEELKLGKEFVTFWGKAIALETGNEMVLWTGEILGYLIVAKKDPVDGAVRIYARADSKVDLTKAYEEVKRQDPDSDWFLHASKKLLLNKTAVNPGFRPTRLSLEQIIKILQGE